MNFSKFVLYGIGIYWCDDIINEFGIIKVDIFKLEICIYIFNRFCYGLKE